MTCNNQSNKLSTANSRTHFMRSLARMLHLLKIKQIWRQIVTALCTLKTSKSSNSNWLPTAQDSKCLGNYLMLGWKYWIIINNLCNSNSKEVHQVIMIGSNRIRVGNNSRRVKLIILMHCHQDLIWCHQLRASNHLLNKDINLRILWVVCYLNR